MQINDFQSVIPMVVERTANGDRAYDIYFYCSKNASSLLALPLTTRSRTLLSLSFFT